VGKVRDVPLWAGSRQRRFLHGLEAYYFEGIAFEVESECTSRQMNTTKCLGIAIIFCAAACADNTDDRGKLMGSWQMEPAAEAGAQWSFSAQGDSVKVTEMESGNKVADFVCATTGTPCDVKISGKKASVSLWYNGAKLVELEQRGSDTVERKFAVAAGADQMEVEVLQMTQGGKSETLKFKRSAAAK